MINNIERFRSYKDKVCFNFVAVEIPSVLINRSFPFEFIRSFTSTRSVSRILSYDFRCKTSRLLEKI